MNRSTRVWLITLAILVFLLMLNWLLSAILSPQAKLARLFSNKPAVVTVNLREALSIPVKLAAKHLTPAEQADFAKRYSAVLPQVIHAYANAHHVTVIAVTTLADPNGLDRTDTLMQQALQQTERGITP